MAFDETARHRCFVLSDHDVAQMNEEQREAYRIGIAVHGFLPTKYVENGGVHTTWGSKSAIGLGRTIKKLVEGEQEPMKTDDEKYRQAWEEIGRDLERLKFCVTDGYEQETKESIAAAFTQVMARYNRLSYKLENP